MRLLYTVIAITLFSSFCQGQQAEPSNSTTGIHTVVVDEIIQTTGYTYLFVKENEKLQWLAVPKMEPVLGATYFWAGGMEMRNFKSTELNRTFESIMFLSGIESKDSFAKKKASNSDEVQPSGSQNTEIYSLEDGVTVAELFANKEKYANQTVRVRGRVTKFNADIMGNNWIHLDDGTNSKGGYDFTATTALTVKVGDVVTIEGVIAIDKDFGFGYLYSVLMEEAKIVK